MFSSCGLGAARSGALLIVCPVRCLIVALGILSSIVITQGAGYS